MGTEKRFIKEEVPQPLLPWSLRRPKAETGRMEFIARKDNNTFHLHTIYGIQSTFISCDLIWGSQYLCWVGWIYYPQFTDEETEVQRLSDSSEREESCQVRATPVCSKTLGLARGWADPTVFFPLGRLRCTGPWTTALCRGAAVNTAHEVRAPAFPSRR